MKHLIKTLAVTSLVLAAHANDLSIPAELEDLRDTYNPEIVFVPQPEAAQAGELGRKHFRAQQQAHQQEASSVHPQVSSLVLEPAVRQAEPGILVINLNPGRMSAGVQGAFLRILGSLGAPRQLQPAPEQPEYIEAPHAEDVIHMNFPAMRNGVIVGPAHIVEPSHEAMVKTRHSNG